MLKSLRIKILSLILVLFYTGIAHAVVLPVTAITTFDFGNFVSGPSGGTINFDANAGSITSGGSIILLGGEAKGLVHMDTTIPGLGVTITVQTVATTLSDGTNTMTLVANCIGPGGTLGGDNLTCTYVSTNNANEAVTIGGKLTVSAAQVAGTYNGTIAVTASYP